MPKVLETRYVTPSPPSPLRNAGQLTSTERHYSYECKASVQERPYASRPSRSQQLRNPKLVPELTNDKPDPLEKKTGVADQELAKKEAERARKRDLDERDDALVESSSKRQRSASYDSVSTISTNATARSVSPRRDDQAIPRGRRPSRGSPPQVPRGQPRYTDSRSYSRSPPPRRRSRSLTPDDRSVSPRGSERSHGDRRYRSPREDELARSQRQSRRYSSSRSPSPAPGGRRGGRNTGPRDGRGSHRAEERVGHGARQDMGRPAEAERRRERSLSPFSKRLAMTQGMNSGQR